MHFIQWMECAMYYEISVFDTTCFQSTMWMLQMYAVGWNMPCTVLLNHHTCFQSTIWISGTYCIRRHWISVYVQYPSKLLNNDDGQWSMLNEYGHLHIGQKTIIYWLSLLTNNNKNLQQISCATTICNFSWCLDKWSKILIDI